MDRQITDIIKKQQEYEKLKHTNYPAIRRMQKEPVARNSFCLQKCLPEIAKSHRKYLIKKILYIIRITLFCMYTAYFICYGLAIKMNQIDSAVYTLRSEKEYQKTPIPMAEHAIENGDYEKAKQILDDAIAKNPDGIFFYYTYAEMYIAAGEYDEAVSVLTDTIYNRLHVQNMFSSSFFYKLLKTIPKESLTTLAEEYQKCLADCNAYVKQYESIDSLIEQEHYYSALTICDNLKSQGASDESLYYRYYQCYIGLKAYDECKNYLDSLMGKKTSITDLMHPDDDTIQYYLDKLETERD